jgi:GDP-4-dehydro-6-deoxy-D-mannose reductase
MNNVKPKILITGITGQVGSTFADYLLSKTDFDVVGMMRWQEPLDNLYQHVALINSCQRFSIEYADLSDHSSLIRVIGRTRPDYVSHLAAQSFPKTSFDIPLETLDTNIMGTARLLEAILHFRNSDGYDPAIHICSSSEVYGRVKHQTAITEDTAFHGSSPYSISKIGTDYLGRFYGEAYGMKTFVTRMGTHSGPRRSDVFFESTVAKQIAMAEAGLQPPVVKVGNLDGVRTYQDARDAVRAYFLLLQASSAGQIPPGEAFNIVGNEVFALSDIVDLLIGMSTLQNFKVQTDSIRLRPIDANYQMFNSLKLSKFITWSPEICVKDMLYDLLTHWRLQVKQGRIPLTR